MNSSYGTKIQPRSAKERSLDISFYWAAKIFAIAIAGTLIWITIQVTLQGLPAITEFGLGFLTTSSWNPVRSE